ncbi:MAG: hypothetical protein JWM19_7656 [Actinomycetia bacterium]|nr:hypothetical protein [Actinomycetes bacterium]
MAAGGRHAVLVRDTMNRGGVVLRFTEGRWQRFADSLKTARKRQ